jgi:hypothetical protein
MCIRSFENTERVGALILIRGSHFKSYGFILFGQLLLSFSYANMSKNGGNVNRNPSPINIRPMMIAVFRSVSRSFNKECRINQLASQAMIPTPVLPESGPTGPHHANIFASFALASAPVVIRPMTKQPTPLEINAAAIAPSILAKAGKCEISIFAL